MQVDKDRLFYHRRTLREFLTAGSRTLRIDMHAEAFLVRDDQSKVVGMLIDLHAAPNDEGYSALEYRNGGSARRWLDVRSYPDVYRMLLASGALVEDFYRTSLAHVDKVLADECLDLTEVAHG